MTRPEGYIVCITVSVLAVVCIFASFISDQFLSFKDYSFGIRRIYTSGFKLSYDSILSKAWQQDYTSKSVGELKRISAMIIIGSFCLCGSIILDIICVWLITVKKHFRARDCCIMVSALWKILTVVIGTYSLCEIKFVVGKILYESGQSMWKDWLQMGFGPSSTMMSVGLSFAVLSILIHFFIILTSSSQVVYRQRPCRREHRTRNQSRTRSFFNFFPTLPPYSPPPPEYSSKPATPAAVNDPENNSGEVHIIENNSQVVSNANTQIETDTTPTVVNIGDVTVPNVGEETRSEPTGQMTPNAEPTNFVF